MRFSPREFSLGIFPTVLSAIYVALIPFPGNPLDTLVDYLNWNFSMGMDYEGFFTTYYLSALLIFPLLGTWQLVGRKKMRSSHSKFSALYLGIGILDFLLFFSIAVAIFFFHILYT